MYQYSTFDGSFEALNEFLQKYPNHKVVKTSWTGEREQEWQTEFSWLIEECI